MPKLLRTKSAKVYGTMVWVRKKRAVWKRLLDSVGIKRGRERKLLLLFLLALIIIVLVGYWLISEMTAYK